MSTSDTAITNERGSELEALVKNAGKKYNNSMKKWDEFFNYFQDSLEHIPWPVDRTPGFAYKDNYLTLDQLFVDIEILNENEQLREIVDSFYERFPNLDTELKETIARAVLINRAVFTIYKTTESGDLLLEDKTRKYEKWKYAGRHPLETLFQGKNDLSDDEVLLEFLHDSIEDSHRYGILKRWYVQSLGIEGAKKEYYEKISDEEYELIGVDPVVIEEESSMQPNKEKKESTLERILNTTNIPEMIKERKTKKAQKIFNQKTQAIVEELLDLVNIDKTSELYTKLSHGLNILTRRPYEEYGKYLLRTSGYLENKSPLFKTLIKHGRKLYHTNLLVKKTIDEITCYEYRAHTDFDMFPEEVMAVMRLKGKDRLGNSNFSVPERERGEGVDDYIFRIADKRIRDATKNWMYLEIVRELSLETEDQDISDAFHGLIDINRKNIDEYIQLMHKTYKKRSDENALYRKKAVSEEFSKFRVELYNEFQDGLFLERTPSQKRRQSLRDFNGSVNSFIEEVDKNVLKTPEEDKEKTGPLTMSATPGKLLRIYKSMLVLKLLSGLYAGHIPFDENGKMQAGLGRYVLEYEGYQLTNFGRY